MSFWTNKMSRRTTAQRDSKFFEFIALTIEQTSTADFR